jgi:cellulose synthase/poly-beta-1,6-N-acetylglucosamine synthase-like glycosyltransferase
MNVRQYNEVNRAVKWMSHNFSSVYPIVLSDIHLTALFTPLYCLTFILQLCLPHCIVWHSSYGSIYLIVLSDIHFTALFTSLYCLTFILLPCLTHCIVWHSFYYSVYPIVLSDIHFTALFNEYLTIQWVKQGSKVNVRQYDVINRAVKWISDNTMR